MKKIILAAAAVLFFALPACAAISAEDAKNIWDKVAQATDLTELPFSVKEEESPNAWVTNGSSVTVTTGLLKVLDTRAELYGVFAHESGHAALKHYESTVSRGTGLSVAASVLGNLLGGIAGAAANVGANLAYAGWSREQEVEADDFAVHLAHKTGEDPVGLYSALLKMIAKGGRTQPSGFNSHPPDDRRLLHIRNEILSLNPKAKFPDGSEKTAVAPVPAQQKEAEPEPQKKDEPRTADGKYDIDAAIERMKREEAAKKKAAGQ